jgi:hypothetical protein
MKVALNTYCLCVPSYGDMSSQEWQYADAVNDIYTTAASSYGGVINMHTSVTISYERYNSQCVVALHI